MKKMSIFFLSFFALNCSIAIVIAQQKKELSSKVDTSIIICYSESTSYYHKSASCPSISKCNNFQKVSLEDAVNKYHRMPCKKCAQIQSTQTH
jgi:hypothetical protein